MHAVCRATRRDALTTFPAQAGCSLFGKFLDLVLPVSVVDTFQQAGDL